ncbi:hypothetical protein OH76DRAFT_892889 [Lentinus brumalis]|uniref:Secreted protein n=1 Tax=Lentinus brumalis TaxID=2498619 RepID=A0A371D167_9APHY|nr:hypothetical protein OH76DRAFT_892889 [Polyporus brumalis]
MTLTGTFSLLSVIASACEAKPAGSQRWSRSSFLLHSSNHNIPSASRSSEPGVHVYPSTFQMPSREAYTSGAGYRFRRRTSQSRHVVQNIRKVSIKRS